MEASRSAKASLGTERTTELQLRPETKNETLTFINECLHIQNRLPGCSHAVAS